MTSGQRKLGVFHPGTQHSWQTAIAFQETGALRWYLTSIYYDRERWPYKIERYLPEPWAARAHRRFLRRFNQTLDPALVRRFGMHEWLEIGAARLRGSTLAQRLNHAGNRDFARGVIAQIEREPVDAIWGFDTSSLQVFRWAKRRGIHCILDRTSIHGKAANAVTQIEFERHPDFFSSEWQPKPPEIIAEEDEEIALADQIVVGSPHCAETLIANGCPPEKVRVVNYGFDETAFPPDPPARQPPTGRPLQFLFVGNVNAMKGMAYLLPAFEQLPADRARLILVGGMALPPATFARYAERVHYVPSVPRNDVIGYYRQADCLVFPSLLEGSSIVLREIYGAGLGAVHTKVAGEGVIPGVNGMFLRPSSTDDILNAATTLLDEPQQLVGWWEATWGRRGQCTWAAYRAGVRRLLEAI